MNIFRPRFVDNIFCTLSMGHILAKTNVYVKNHIPDLVLITRVLDFAVVRNAQKKKTKKKTNMR